MAEQDNQGNNQQLNIQLPENVAEGIYSNLAVIGHSPSEFVIDFIRLLPGMQQGKVRSRIILTPQNAKRLMKALNENVSKFEEAFGAIADPEMDRTVN